MVVSGKQGVKVAKEVPGVLVDPATYVLQGKNEPEGLFDYDDWLIRQQAAGRSGHSHRHAADPE